MKATDLKEKVLKAEEAVAKIEKTIERHKAQAEKKLKVITDNGWNPEDRYCKYGTAEHDEAYWAICEYESKLVDIQYAEKKLAEKQKTLQNWKNRLEAAEAKEQKFMKEVPDCLKALMNELIIEWDEHDTNRREYLKKIYKEVGYKAFFKGTPEKNYYDSHTRADYDFMDLTDEQIHKSNVENAESMVMDLYNRVHAITGEVTDWSDMHYGGKALNGTVHGKLGSVRVESILAGGYNIQKLHVRVLVHEIK